MNIMRFEHKGDYYVGSEDNWCRELPNGELQYVNDQSVYLRLKGLYWTTLLQKHIKFVADKEEKEKTIKEKK